MRARTTKKIKGTTTGVQTGFFTSKIRGCFRPQKLPNYELHPLAYISICMRAAFNKSV